MNTFLIILCFVLVVVIAFLLFSRRKSIGNSQKVSQIDATGNFPLSNTQESSLSEHCNFVIEDERNEIIVQSNEISEIPCDAVVIDDVNKPEIRRTLQFASDLIKGAASVPNKTVEIVFSPEVQKGLSEGAFKLMTSKSGEVYADAMHGTTAARGVVEKGKIIQSGQIKQLATAGFQIASIAVAQSHLADIEKSLSEIKGLLNEIKDNNENSDLSKIKGHIDFLSVLAKAMSNYEISQEQRNRLPAIETEFYESREKLNSDLESLIERIKSLKSEDTFGTENTYKKFNQTILYIYILQKRRNFLLNLKAAYLYVSAFDDPVKGITNFNSNDRWNDLMDTFQNEVEKKADELLRGAFWNFQDTVDKRKRNIFHESGKAVSSVKMLEREFERQMLALQINLQKLTHEDGKIHLAMTFDEHGELVKSALL